MNKKSRVELVIALVLAIGLMVACSGKHQAGRPTSVKRPAWSDEKAQQAVDSMSTEYRSKGDAFWKERTYVWSGTWVWPETIGIGVRNLDLLKKMFYDGDDEAKEIVLQVIFMNIPSKKLEKKGKSFLTDLTRFDTDVKERKANVPPPNPQHEYIEEYITPPEPQGSP